MTESIVPFLIASFILNISPGPDLVYVISRTLAQGRLVGLVSSWGVCSGAMVHVLLAAFGFSVLIQNTAWAYTALQYLGVVYLFYLGINSLRCKTLQISGTGVVAHKVSLPRIYLQGVMVDLINPKAALFFLAFLPQFIPAGTTEHSKDFILLGSIVVLMGIVCEACIVLFSDFFLGRLLKNSKAVSYLNYALGIVFIGLAINLAFF